MKNILLSVFLLITVTFVSHGQTILLQEDFDTYNGTIDSVPAGFYISWNDTTTVCTNCSSPSFYTGSSTICGVACNAYKFGVDSATIITPVFANPGSVSFYYKGAGSNKPNSFLIYETTNGSTWNLLDSINPISLSAQAYNHTLASNIIQLKFFYNKDSIGLNVGFDDLFVYGPVGINETKSVQGISIYPSPSSGMITANFNENYFSDVEIKVINILGKEVKHYDLKNISSKYVMNISNEPDGIYLLKIKSGTDEMVKRIILKK